MDEENIIREIWWKFRNAIHNGHKQMKTDDSYCYVCDVLTDLEEDISEIFGTDKYYKVRKTGESSNG